MAANDFLPFATGAGSNVLSQALWDELAARTTGFQKGLLPSAQVNKALRQSAIMVSAIAQLIADKTDQDVLDDGDRAALMGLFEEMVGIVALEQTGAIVFKGTWNASTNNPTLASGVGVAGWLYTVSVAGATSLDGIDQWNVGDKAVFNGVAWEKIEGQGAEVLSVAGRVGNVVLTVSDVGIATQLEAEAGLVNDKAMTPLRTAQAIAALAGGGGGPIGPAQVELLQTGAVGQYEITHPSLAGADLALITIGVLMSGSIGAAAGNVASATVAFYADDTFTYPWLDKYEFQWVAVNGTPVFAPSNSFIQYRQFVAPVFDGSIFVDLGFAPGAVTGASPNFLIYRGFPAPL